MVKSTQADKIERVQIQEAQYRGEQQRAAEDAFANRLIAEDEAALMQQTLQRTAQREADRSIAQTLDTQVYFQAVSWLFSCLGS